MRKKCLCVFVMLCLALCFVLPAAAAGQQDGVTPAGTQFCFERAEPPEDVQAFAETELVQKMSSFTGKELKMGEGFSITWIYSDGGWKDFYRMQDSALVVDANWVYVLPEKNGGGTILGYVLAGDEINGKYSVGGGESGDDLAGAVDIMRKLLRNSGFGGDARVFSWGINDMAVVASFGGDERVIYLGFGGLKDEYHHVTDYKQLPTVHDMFLEIQRNEDEAAARIEELRAQGQDVSYLLGGYDVRLTPDVVRERIPLWIALGGVALLAAAFAGLQLGRKKRMTA